MKPKNQVKPRRSFSKILIPIAVVLLFTWSGYRMPQLLPRELNGVWTTDDPHYLGRSLELSSAFVIIMTGPTDPASVQMIDRVTKAQVGNEIAVTVYSTDYSDGSHYQMALLFNPAGGGELRFRNQPIPWKRQARALP